MCHQLLCTRRLLPGISCSCWVRFLMPPSDHVPRLSQLQKDAPLTRCWWRTTQDTGTQDTDWWCCLFIRWDGTAETSVIKVVLRCRAPCWPAARWVGHYHGANKGAWWTWAWEWRLDDGLSMQTPFWATHRSHWCATNERALLLRSYSEMLEQRFRDERNQPCLCEADYPSATIAPSFAPRVASSCVAGR